MLPGVGGAEPPVRAFREAFLAMAVLAASRFGDDAVFMCCCEGLAPPRRGPLERKGVCMLCRASSLSSNLVKRYVRMVNGVVSQVRVGMFNQIRGQ